MALPTALLSNKYFRFFICENVSMTISTQTPSCYITSIGFNNTDDMYLQRAIKIHVLEYVKRACNETIRAIVKAFVNYYNEHFR